MPDISMCYGVSEKIECPVKKLCYRFTVTPSTPQQAYIGFPMDSEGRCGQFWSVIPPNQIKKPK